MKLTRSWTPLLWGIGALLWAAALAVFLQIPEQGSPTEPTYPPEPCDAAVMDAYDGLISAELEKALDAIAPPVFTIPADAQVAPEPNQACYGQAKDASELQWLLEDAAEILEGQETLFSTETPVYARGQVDYYLDKTIFAVTWEQVIDNFVYTISEVKIAHPSQFRRYLPDATYGSRTLYVTTTMSAMSNAVVASSGDYYLARKHGITTYQGQVHRFYAADSIDSCFVDENGDLILMPAGSFSSKEAVQEFVDENNISFSLAFGPILVEDGKRCEPQYYPLGEVNDGYPRAALCQMDELHYLIVTANGHGIYWEYPTIHGFAARVAEFGCQRAYALDGGQTAAIVMNDKLINPIQFGFQRIVSDMFYFATALPELTPQE